MLVNICKDHTGSVERVNVILDNIKTYYDVEEKTYLFTFGTNEGYVYCSYEYHKYNNHDTFFKVKDIPIQISLRLLDIFQRSLSQYVSENRDNKLQELLNI